VTDDAPLKPDFELGPDHVELRSWVHDFAADVVRPAAAEWDEREEFPWPVVEEAAKIGLYSLDFFATQSFDETGLGLPVTMEELFWGDAGIALSIVGPILRPIFGVLATAAALFLGWTTLQLLVNEPLSAVGPTVTETTGLAGSTAIADVVAGIELSAWPVMTLIAWVLLLAASLVVLLTWRRWKTGGRRYRTDASHVEAGDGPVDAIDSWDDLSRGTDPTR
jgi:hypothetical protein